MSEERKSFFAERSVAEIKELKPKWVNNAKGLVRKIDGLDSSKEAMIIAIRLLPGEFYQFTDSWAEASRKAYKHGDYVALGQPQTQEEALRTRESPLQIRARDLDVLRGIREEEIQTFGYSFRPVQGRDRRKRLVPFAWIMEGTKLFSYAANLAEGIKVEPYADSGRVAREGAEIVVTIPSRTKKKSRYKVKLSHVPVVDRPEKNAVVWSLRSTYDEGRAPLHSLYNVRFTFEREPEASDVLHLYPQDVAAYLAVARQCFEENKNFVPWNMNPFAKPSQRAASFYGRLGNNVLVYDPSIKTKDHLRKLHVAERSLLIAREIGVFGHDQTMFWNPEVDPKLKDYSWK